MTTLNTSAAHTPLESTDAKVHVFDPDLPPEAKKEQVQREADHVLTGSSMAARRAPATATDLPTHDTAETTAALSAAAAKSVSATTEVLPEMAAASSSKKSEAGWTAFSPLPNPGDEAALAATGLSADAQAELYKNSLMSGDAQDDWLSQKLKDTYYGQWYHNGAAMLAAVLFTYILTRLGAGIFGCLVVGAFLVTYYQSSSRRLRRNVRDDIQRELSINRLETDEESAGWINHFLDRFWLIYEPVLSAQIIGTGDAILSENTPSFLDSIRLTTFTLGTKAPRIDGIKTYPRTEPNVVCMDWKVSFTPTDILDLTKRDLQSKVNPKIVLTIRVGSGMIGAGMPVLLEDVAFRGHLQVKIKLFSEFPHVKSVEASFLEKPYFDYVLKPIGGDVLGFDINNIPGLQSFIAEQVHANLGPMMYAPNVFTVNVAELMAGGVDLDAANGILAVTIYSGEHLQSADLFGTLDPYVTFHVGSTNHPELARTTTFENNTSPKWNETHFLLLNNLNDSLYFHAMDRNSGRKDSSIGVANFDLKDVAQNDGVAEGLNLTLLRNGKPVGELKCDISYFPVSKPEKGEDGTVIPAAESNSGILRFTVNECKEVGSVSKKKSGLPLVGGVPLVGNLPMISGSNVSSYATVRINGQEKMRTSTYKRSINPRWNSSVEVFVTDKSKLDIGVHVMNSSEFAEDELLGRWTSSLLALESQLKEGTDWWQLKDGVGRINLAMQWKPVVMTGFAEGLGHGIYRPPIGVVRLEFFAAEGLKNVEALSGGKSDPYVRVLSATQVRAQTESVLDDLDPKWDEVLYVPVHSIREDLVFEVMDWNKNQSDKSLGLSDFILKDIIKESTNPDTKQVVYEATERIDRWAHLTNSQRKTGKGRIHYAASFYPTLELAQEAGQKDNAEKEKVEKPEDTGALEALPTTDVHGHHIRYTADQKIDFASYSSGILSVTIHEANFAEKKKQVIAEILLDANDPQYRTAQLQGVHLPFNETGDAFVKELEFSKLLVRLRRAPKSGEGDAIEHIGYYSRPVSDIIRHLQTQSDELEGRLEPLLDCPQGTIRLSFKFTPVIDFVLDPRESLENQGNLTITLLSAHKVKAVDRSGKSDPYVVLLLNDEQVYESHVYKKQLDPVFNREMTTLPVMRRTEAVLKAQIYDWDQIGKNTLLAEGVVAFGPDALESFVAKTVELPMTGGDGTLLKMRLKWEPQLLARQRATTSLLGTTRRMLTGAPGSALGAAGGAGGKVIGGGISLVGTGLRGIGKVGGLRSKASVGSRHTTAMASTPDVNLAVPNTRGSEESARPMSILDGTGKIKVTLIAGADLKAMNRDKVSSDPYARVRLGRHKVYKTHYCRKTCSPEWNESFTTPVSATHGVLEIKVKDHNTLTDVDIGTVTLDVTDEANLAFDGWLELEPKGNGKIHIKVECMSQAP